MIKEKAFQSNYKGKSTVPYITLVKRMGVAADHGGFELKIKLIAALKAAGYDLVDFGAEKFDKDDDYPDFVVPMARAVARGEVVKGLAICGSGVGACVTANKVSGVRAALITDPFSAHQGVEDDNMNIICLGGNVTGYSLALELITLFLTASFKGTEPYVRRLRKVLMLESESQSNVAPDTKVSRIYSRFSKQMLFAKILFSFFKFLNEDFIY
jgi:ribose 5-phosphate isomerase B